MLLGGIWLEVLKFNRYCSIFVLSGDLYLIMD